MKTFIKEQFPAGTPNEDAESSSGENKPDEEAIDLDSNIQVMDQHFHVTLRQMYHIFDYFTQESYFGKQVKDIRKELDGAKRDIVFGNVNHEEFKAKCIETFKE